MNILKGLRIVAGVGLLASAGAVQALTFNTVGDTYSVDFNGIVEDAGEGTVVPGLTATLDYQLTDLTATTATLKVTVTNTTTLANSRVSLTGFNIDPDTSNATSSGIFNKVGSGNVPQLLVDRELCFSDKNGNPNCSAGGNGGVVNTSGSNTGMFTAMLTFGSALTNGFTLSDLFVRYQSIVGTDLGTSGVGVPLTPVPLPAAAWLFLTGIVGLFGWSRRRAATAS